jgi:CRISPR/Cas system CSM-associated protein Csm3 (group 7 of RAMP superfamily)
MKEEIWEITLSTEHSPLLIGGWNSSAIWDRTTAMDDEKPIIPASAIKGAFRIEFERLMRGIGKNVCNISSSDDKEERGCDNCISCALFGGGNKEGKLRFSKGKLNPREEVKFFPKVGVAISRKSRTAVEKKLYSMLTYRNNAEFKTEIFSSNLDEEERRTLIFFFNYLKSTGIYIGGRKGVGYGYFNLHYENKTKQKEGKISSQVKLENDEWKFYELTIGLKEPFMVGDSSIRKYILNTLDYIPASTVRGAIAFGLIKKGLDENIIKKLFQDEKKYVRVSDFYYENEKPVFLTEKKEKGGNNSSRDTLIYSFLLAKFLEKEEFNEELYRKVFGTEKNPLSPADLKKPSILYNIKLTLNRNTLASHPERLVGIKSWEKESGEFCKYKGIIFIPETLKKILEDLKIYLGGQRSRGYGMGEINEIKEKEINEWTGSLEKFNKKLNALSEDFKIDLDGRIFFTIDFLSNAVLPEKGIEEKIKSIFPPSLKIEPGTVISTGWLGGYKEFPGNKGVKSLKKVITHGSVILASVDKSDEENFKKVIKEINSILRLDDIDHGIFSIIDICNKKHY